MHIALARGQTVSRTELMPQSREGGSRKPCVVADRPAQFFRASSARAPKGGAHWQGAFRRAAPLQTLLCSWVG